MIARWPSHEEEIRDLEDEISHLQHIPGPLQGEIDNLIDFHDRLLTQYQKEGRCGNLYRYRQSQDTPGHTQSDVPDREGAG